MRDNSIYLKVKIKSLAAEAKIIRQEERKARERRNRTLQIGLASHRRGIVRHEARHSQLAYGFLRGMPYHKMEAKCHGNDEPEFGKVYKLVQKFGVQREWLEVEMTMEPLTNWNKRSEEQDKAYKQWREECE